jgi:signal transduction histidine kinase
MMALFSLQAIQNSPYALMYLMTAALLLLMGIIVYISNYRSNSYFAFLAISLPVAVWLISDYLDIVIPFGPSGERLAETVSKIEYIGVPLISFTFSFFIFCFLQLVDRYKYYFIVLSAFSVGFILLGWFSGFFIHGVYRYHYSLFDMYYVKFSAGGYAFLAYFVSVACFTFYVLLQNYRSSDRGLRKNQMKVFLIAYLTAYTAIIDFLPCLGFHVLPTGVFSICVYLVLMTWAFLKEKVFDIKNAFLIVFINTFFVLLLFTFAFLVLLNRDIYHFVVTQNPIGLSMLLTFFLLLLFGINALLRPVLRQFISKNIANLGSCFLAFLDKIKAYKNIEGLIGIINDTILSSLNLDSCKIYLSAANGITLGQDLFQVTPEINDKMQLLETENIREIHEYKNILYLQKYQHVREKLIDLMKNLNSRCTIPIFYKQEFLGIIALGKKMSGHEFSEVEIEFLRNIQAEFGIHLRAAIFEKKSLQHQAELAHAEKLITMGTIVAEVAHEINNPNHSLFLDAQTNERAWESVTPLLNERADEQGDFKVGVFAYGVFKQEIAALSNRMKRNCERIKRIVEDLRLFAKKDIDVKEELNINTVIRSSLSVVEHVTMKCTKNLRLQLSEPIPCVKGSVRHLEQVVINIVKNACQSLPSADKAVSISTSSADKNVIITVSDEGKGMDEEMVKNIFTPFYTTKGKEGTGLGLSICNNIVKNHGGRIEVESTIGKGTVVKVILPASNAPIT